MTVTVDFMLLSLAGILTFMAVRSTYFILKFLAGVAWWGLGVYWTATPFTTAGSPAMTIAIMLVFFVGIAIFFMPLWYTRYSTEGKETGGRFRLPFMKTDEEEELATKNRYLPTRGERNAIYRDRVDMALQGKVRRKE